MCVCVYVSLCVGGWVSWSGSVVVLGNFSQHLPSRRNDKCYMKLMVRFGSLNCDSWRDGGWGEVVP